MSTDKTTAAASAAKAADRIRYNCAGPVIGHYSAEEAEALDKPNLVGHKKRNHCGADLTAMIDKIPFDGKTRKIKCGNCGTLARILRTPIE